MYHQFCFLKHHNSVPMWKSQFSSRSPPCKTAPGALESYATMRISSRSDFGLYQLAKSQQNAASQLHWIGWRMMQITADIETLSAPVTCPSSTKIHFQNRHFDADRSPAIFKCLDPVNHCPSMKIDVSRSSSPFRITRADSPTQNAFYLG